MQVQKNGSELPEPHPLDFDWRFSIQTVEELRQIAPLGKRILAVGTPSLARRLEALQQDVLLIDRQPEQGVKNHLPIEVGQEVSGDMPSFAFVDPPWYPSDFYRWIAWTARLVGVGGEIIASIWPNETRPSAAEEAELFHRWTLTWSETTQLTIVPHYEAPRFEINARQAAQSDFLSVSPRFGRLVALRVKTIPTIPLFPSPELLWTRFIIDNYQLALGSRASVFHRSAKMIEHPNAVGWSWPFVSRRAPNRNLINLWSSRNEVAIVRSPSELMKTLRSAFSAPDSTAFSQALREFPELEGWAIPRPPYWRYVEWRHML